MPGNTLGRKLWTFKKCIDCDSNVVVPGVKLYPVQIINHCTITASLTASPNKVLSSSLEKLSIDTTYGP